MLNCKTDRSRACRMFCGTNFHSFSAQYFTPPQCFLFLAYKKIIHTKLCWCVQDLLIIQDFHIRGVDMKFPEWCYYKLHTYIQLTEVFPLSSCVLSSTMLLLLELFWNSCYGIDFSAVITFFRCFQYSEIVSLRQTLTLETSKVIWSQMRGIGWVFRFSNGFLGQKLLDRERFVSWSIVMVENSIVEPNFRPFCMYSFT